MWVWACDVYNVYLVGEMCGAVYVGLWWLCGISVVGDVWWWVLCVCVCVCGGCVAYLVGGLVVGCAVLITTALILLQLHKALPENSVLTVLWLFDTRSCCSLAES